jgi:SPP1 gp7 family putative phage head morphogenesis protein
MPILNSNSLDFDIDFIWEDVSDEETELKVANIQRLLATMGISENMKRALEIELARLLKLEDLIEILPEPEKGLENSIDPRNPQLSNPGFMDVKIPEKPESTPKSKERTKEENMSQPEMPGAKTKSSEDVPLKEQQVNAENVESVTEVTHNEAEICDCELHNAEPIKENVDLNDDMTIQEWMNFKDIQEKRSNVNYSDLILKTLQVLKTDPFKELSAKNEEEIKIGLLNEKDITKVRLILKNGFKNNQSIRQIEKELKENIEWKDRLDSEDNLLLSKEYRPNIVARTETIRIANEGLIELYKENNVRKVSWLAAVSERTCDQCMELSGQIFEINEAPIPTQDTHPNCRCTLLSVIE